MNKVWLTGDAVVDLIPDGGNRYLKCPGGAPANVAVAIARLGGTADFFGRAGHDPMGLFMKKELKNENVGTSHFHLDIAHRTSTVVVDLDDHGERSFTFMVKPSADQFLQLSDIPSFNTGEWLHVCSIALANEPSRSTTLQAMRQLKAIGGFVSFDPNLREEVWEEPADIIPVIHQALALADVVKFSEEELTFLTHTSSIEKGLEALSDLSIPLILVTLGAKGTLVYRENISTIIPSIRVNVVDTTGAGDAFVGGVLARLSQDTDWQHNSVIEEAVQWGNRCGGLATTKKGAMTALPTRQELLAK